jgi:hypothetical protein
MLMASYYNASCTIINPVEIDPADPFGDTVPAECEEAPAPGEVTVSCRIERTQKQIRLPDGSLTISAGTVWLPPVDATGTALLLVPDQTTIVEGAQRNSILLATPDNDAYGFCHGWKVALG